MDSLTPTTPRTGARRALVTLSFTLVALLGVGTLSPAQAAVPAAVAPTRLAAAKKPPAPRTVKVAKNSYGKFRLKWSKAKRAKGYRVIVARDKKMKKVVLRTKYTTKRSQWVHGKKIKEGVRYYVQVQSHASKRVKGKKSKPKAVRPLTKPVKKPEKLEVRATGLTSVRVTWKPAKYATGYTVKLRATKNGAPFWSKRVVGKSKKALNVKNINTKRYGNTFFVTVTADRKKRTFRDSETPIASTLAPYTSGRTVASGIKVASYNVQGHQTKTAWDARGDRIASIIAGRDIVGIQELTYGRTWGTQTRPIQDLADRTGLTYPITYDA
ncbi:MAG: hypothetical protein GX593_09260, partial [Actinomycetales bacterium]|nr:hypothetical protein [Actinomycetales bacterium]